jgi:competence protein ComEC
MAHHGAYNGFNSVDFLSRVKPLVTVCTSDFDNQYGHPNQIVRDILFKNCIQLATTKTGDVIIESIGNYNLRFRVYNFQGNSKNISSVKEYWTKKKELFLLRKLGLA